MRLEKEIAQPRFRNEHHKAMVNLIYTYNWLTERLKKTLHTHQLTLQQFNVLRILRGQHPEPATINLLKDRMLDKMSDVSRIVERLRKKALVQRRPSTDDRRAAAVKITPAGLELLKKLDQQETCLDGLLERLSTAEAEQLNHLLDRLRK